MCTVVIPCRNRHDQLLEAVRSAVSIPVVAEVIVVDDGSSPPMDPQGMGGKIRVVQNRLLSGAQGARVTGAMEASSDIILFLDSDDTLCADGVEALHRTLASSNDLALVYGKVRGGSHVLDVLRVEGYGFRAVLKNLSLCPFSGLMVRKAMVPWEALDLTLPAWQDDDFVLCVAKRAPIAFVDVITSDMAPSVDSISASRVKRFVGLVLLVERWKADLLAEFGHGRLFVWRLRQLAVFCSVIAQDWPAFGPVGRAIQWLTRPFFDRVYP